MRGFNFNISSLFSNLGSGNAFGSFNFSDYASIKNGSYGKLVKSYYAEQKKTPESDKATTTKPTKKEETVDKTGLSQMKKEADGLKSAAEALNKEEVFPLIRLPSFNSIAQAGTCLSSANFLATIAHLRFFASTLA